MLGMLEDLIKYTCPERTSAQEVWQLDILQYLELKTKVNGKLFCQQGRKTVEPLPLTNSLYTRSVRRAMIRTLLINIKWRTCKRDAAAFLHNMYKQLRRAGFSQQIVQYG